MDDTTILGGVLNQLGQAAKQTAKQIVKVPGEMAEDAKNQVTGTGSAGLAKSPNEQSGGQGQEQKRLDGWKSDEERVKFLKGLYGISEKDSSAKKDSEEKKPDLQKTSANPLAKAEENKNPTEFQEQIADLSPEEQRKLIELRNQLHKENYYDPLINPVKKQEERPAEKVENEKKKEMMELQKKEEKKPQPLAVTREQNKAEMFRGAAG